MDNFVLFICGVAITLISAMGVLVYMVSLGYQQTPKRKKPVITLSEIPKEEIKKSMESFVDIPSVS
jgi:hypothetical protein